MVLLITIMVVKTLLTFVTVKSLAREDAKMKFTIFIGNDRTHFNN